MKYQFKDACIEVHLSTLVEHYQTLMRAVETSDWDDVWCVMECLSENISYGMKNAKTDFKFTPSPTSLLAMNCQSGILCNADGSDIQCGGHHGVSDAEQHCETCRYHGKACKPEQGTLLLNCGLVYSMSDDSNRDEFLLPALEADNGRDPWLWDVIDYLNEQDDEYFSERCTTRSAVLSNRELLDRIAAEHRKCVEQFGNERDWSVKDACDNEPGIE